MHQVKGSEVRKTDYPIDKIFLDRWSPRAMSGEEISDEELFTLFEAGRWAPSSNNEQPWRFIYVKRKTKNWNKIFDALNEFNRLWTQNASALICLVAKKNFTKDDSPNRNHLSDSGASWENVALQASLKKLVCHGMAGYDLEVIRKNLHVPEDFDIVHVFAIGKPARKDVLPERMQKSEHPNGRKPLGELVSEGGFNEKIR